MAPKLTGIDHIHVFVSDRVTAEDWYRRVLGLVRAPALESWAAAGGPVTVADESGQVHLALFERPRQNCRSVVSSEPAARNSCHGSDIWSRRLAASSNQSTISYPGRCTSKTPTEIPSKSPRTSTARLEPAWVRQVRLFF